MLCRARSCSLRLSVRMHGRRQSTNKATAAALNFDDAKVAFASKSTTELLLHAAVFKVCSYDIVVRNCDSLIKLGENVVGKDRLASWILKPTFFDHFCGTCNRLQVGC